MTVAGWRDARRSSCMPIRRERRDAAGKLVGVVFWDAEHKPSGWRWAAGMLRSRDQWTNIDECCAACDAVLDAPTKGKP